MASDHDHSQCEPFGVTATGAAAKPILSAHLRLRLVVKHARCDRRVDPHRALARGHQREVLVEAVRTRSRRAGRSSAGPT